MASGIPPTTMIFTSCDPSTLFKAERPHEKYRERGDMRQIIPRCADFILSKIALCRSPVRVHASAMREQAGLHPHASTCGSCEGTLIKRTRLSFIIEGRYAR